MAAARCEQLQWLTNMPGPTILRAAASRTSCETALNELTHPVVIGEQDSYFKYELTPGLFSWQKHPGDCLFGESSYIPYIVSH